MINPAAPEPSRRGIGASQGASFWRRRQFLCLLAMFGVHHARAQTLPPPSSPVILVVKGLIGRTNVGDEAHLDRELLEGFGVDELNTWTPWTDGDIEFTGILLRNLLEQLQASGAHIRARALNDYFVDIPVADAQRYDVLVAMSGSGVDFSRRGKGPLWIVYPWSQHPELETRLTNHKSIWQLDEIYIYE